jgi:hypothetical protein
MSSVANKMLQAAAGNSGYVEGQKNNLLLQGYNPALLMWLDITDINNISSIDSITATSGAGYSRDPFIAVDETNELFFLSQASADAIDSYSYANDTLTYKDRIVDTTYLDNYQFKQINVSNKKLYVFGSGGGGTTNYVSRFSYTTNGALSKDTSVIAGASVPGNAAINANGTKLFLVGTSGSTKYISYVYNLTSTTMSKSTSLATSSTPDYSNFSRVKMDSSEDYLFITDNSKDGVLSFDVSNPLSASLADTLVGNIDLAYNLEYDETNEVLIVQARNPNDLHIVDVSDPTNMVLKGNVSYSSLSGNDSLVGLALDSARKLAFYGMYQSTSILIINYSDLDNPTSTTFDLTSLYSTNAGNVSSMAIF